METKGLRLEVGCRVLTKSCRFIFCYLFILREVIEVTSRMGYKTRRRCCIDNFPKGVYLGCLLVNVTWFLFIKRVMGSKVVIHIDSMDSGFTGLFPVFKAQI